MRNQFIWKQRVQEEKEHLKDYEIFESADYMELLRSITSEITGGTLKEAVVEETRILSEKWNANAWCVRVLIELIGLLEEDDKERRRIAKEVEKEMEEAMKNDAAA